MHSTRFESGPKVNLHLHQWYVLPGQAECPIFPLGLLMGCSKVKSSQVSFIVISAMYTVYSEMNQFFTS